METFDNKEGGREEKDTPLYTEKIVMNPKKKYRKTIKAVKILGQGIVVGMIACIMIAMFLPVIHKNLVDDMSEKEKLVIEKDEYERENKEEETPPDKENSTVSAAGISYENAASELKNISKSVLQYLVVIDSYSSDVEDFITEAKSQTESVGAVIGSINSEYIIVTQASVVEDHDRIVVRFSEDVEVEARICGIHETSAIAVLAVKESQIPAAMRSSVLYAQLGNSYDMDQGDVVIAAGKIFNNTLSVDYSMLTEITEKSIVDNSMEIFGTGIVGSPGDYGFLFKLDGTMVAIAGTNEEGRLISAGISDLKGIIQELSNGNTNAYLGIKGQNVTSTIANMYGLPMGIYITEVEIDSPAFEAGLQSGDVITSINADMVLTMQQYNQKLYEYGVGRQIDVKAMRQGKDGYKEMDFWVIIGGR